jgi:outer membrane protein assembly factor BamE (lipoprotein component of BamABCDE complex)
MLRGGRLGGRRKEQRMKARSLVLIPLAAAAILAAAPARAAGYIDSPQQLAQVRAGSTTARELEQLLGAPLRKLSFPARGVDAWEYEISEGSKRAIISISIGRDGVVRELLRIRLDQGM